MNKTKIDWADATWNPVTGCQHDCPYCYARKIAMRYGGHDHDESKAPVGCANAIGSQRLASPKYIMRANGLQKAPYPWFFLPTLHEYRLDEPEHIRSPKTIFVCSMADLFGDWVPDEWIAEVFKACETAPQHRYLFLTKNPKRLCELANAGELPKRDNYWYGSTIADRKARRYPGRITDNTFLSIEPLMEPLNAGLGSFGGDRWIIIGAETGTRKGKIVPEKEWVLNIVEAAAITHAPVFMKESLRGLMGDDFVQEFPWEVQL